MEKVISGQTVLVNEEGYLQDFNQWNPAIAEEIAKEEGIELTPRHWDIITWLQEQEKNKIALTIRKLGKSGVTDIKEFYTLFPNGPLKKATKIAGIKKPVGCI